MHRSAPHPAAARAVAATLFALLASCSPNSSGAGILDTVFAPADPARFAYTVNMGDSTLSIFVVDPGTGRLTHQGYFAFPNVEVMPEALAVHHSREFLFVVSAVTETVSVLRIDRATGALTPVSLQVGAGGAPHDIVAHPSLDFVYVSSAASQTVVAYVFDPETGELTVPADGTRETFNPAPMQLLMDPRGRYVASLHYAEGRLQTFGISSSSGTLSSDIKTLNISPAQIGAGVIDSVGSNVYVSVPNFDTVTRIEIGGGFQPILREVRTTEFDPTDTSTPSALALHPTGNYLYVLNQGTQQIFYFSVDRSTQTLVQQGFLGPTAGAQQIWFDPIGVTGYLVDDAQNSIARYAWDSATGALSFRDETRTRPTPLDLGFVQDEDPPNLRVDRLYVASRGSNEIRVFAVSAATGELAQLGDPAPTGSAPLDFALARPRPFAFAVNGGSANMTRYSVLADGTLVPLAPPAALSGVPAAVVVEPSGRFVYAASRGTATVQGFAIGAAGDLFPLDGPWTVGDDPTAMRVDPTGRFLYVANGGQQGGGPGGTISIFSLSPLNGALTQVIPGGTAPGGPLNLAFAPTGARLYVPVVEDDAVLPYVVSPADGTLTPIGSGSAALIEPVDLALSPTGRFAYVALRNAGQQGAVQLYDLRITDGALVNAEDESFTPRQTLLVGPSPVAIVIDPHERFLFVADSISDEIWRLAIASDGTLTPLGTVPTGAMPSDLELTTRVE